jgi:hypothetical protein
MRRCIGTAVVLLLLCCIAACQTENTGTTPSPTRDAAFAVTALDGEGSYVPRLMVEEQSEDVVVTVTATGADRLSAAYFHLHYDTTRYSPTRVEFGDFLGRDDETLSLGLTDVADVVPVGITQIRSRGATPVRGDGVIARVHFSRDPFVASRSVASAPDGEPNKIEELLIIGQTGTTATLRWTEKNVGDYNNDSLVSINDLTPLGFYFNQNVAATDDPLKAGLVDGNGDGQINISDISQIGQYFDNKMSGYKLYVDSAGTSEYNSGITCTRAAAVADTVLNPNPSHPIKYTKVAEIPVGSYVAFTVRPVDESDLANPGVVSDSADLVIDPDPPQAPTNFTADSDSHQTVDLAWTKSTSLDVEYYILERRLDSDGTWGEVVQLDGTATSYPDVDNTFVEEPYTYRIHAKDYTEKVSPYVEAGPVTPFFVPPPDPPQNVNASGGSELASIEITWDPPADDSDVFKYRVYCMGPGETEFTEIHLTFNKYVTNYLHSSLTVGETYEYYVKSVGNSGGNEVESVPSDTDQATPSDALPISITDLTTDKITHFNGTSVPPEANANLTVTTSVPPTSVDWSATGGTITPSGSTAVWERTVDMAPGVVTVTCTAWSGPLSDEATIELIVTVEPILDEYGDNGKFKTGAPTDIMLERLIDGGDQINGRQFEYYMGKGDVVGLATFDTG